MPVSVIYPAATRSGSVVRYRALMPRVGVESLLVRVDALCDRPPVNDLAGAASILSAMSAAVDGPFSRLHALLPASYSPEQPRVELFNIVENDVGIAVQVSCTRGDGRLISWLIETWIYPTSPIDWTAVVRAEIDLDDRGGEDRCVLNEQLVATDAASVAQAVARCSQVVLDHPREHLLTPEWEPADWVEDQLDP